MCHKATEKKVINKKIPSDNRPETSVQMFAIETKIFVTKITIFISGRFSEGV